MTTWAPIAAGWLLMTGVTIVTADPLAATACGFCSLLALLTAYHDRLRHIHVSLLENTNRLLEAKSVAQGERNHLLALKLARFERSAENQHR